HHSVDGRILPPPFAGLGRLCGRCRCLPERLDAVYDFSGCGRGQRVL
ncbi:hypothetical protein VTH06DRAFT_2553, partial [Thermothelomyces fergusii]